MPRWSRPADLGQIRWSCWEVIAGWVRGRTGNIWVLKIWAMRLGPGNLTFFLLDVLMMFWLELIPEDNQKITQHKKDRVATCIAQQGESWFFSWNWHWDNLRDLQSNPTQSRKLDSSLTLRLMSEFHHLQHDPQIPWSKLEGKLQISLPTSSRR